MAPEDFIEDVLHKFPEPDEIKSLISEIFDDTFFLEFIDCNFCSANPKTGYAAMPIQRGTKIFFNSNNINTGYLAHELFHAKLYKRKFPDHSVFYEKNESQILKLLGRERNSQIFNCLAHLLFFNEYILRGFEKKDFIDSYNIELIDFECLEKFCQQYNPDNKDNIISFLEKFITIISDMNNERTESNNRKLSALKTTDGFLFSMLNKLTEAVQQEKNLENVSNYLNEFYNNLDETITGRMVL